VPVLDLGELVRAKVHERLERMNGELEALVATAVDEELDRLVAAELAERGVPAGNASAANGRDGAGDGSTSHPEDEATKRCRRCGEVKTPADFQPRRAVCRVCRTAETVARQRQRRAERADPLAAGAMSPTSHDTRPEA
jgi:hypothetical protein